MAEKLFRDHERLSQLSVACRNSGNDCVIAGPLNVLSEFTQLCGNIGIKAKLLAVPYGFHSPAMDPIMVPLQELGRSIRWSPPLIPVASNVHGRFLESRDLQSNYFALHARQPVLFAETIQAFHSEKLFDNALCIEIGPHPITLPILMRSLPEGICSFVSTLQKDRPSWATISAALSQIFLVANDIDWREVFSGSGARMTDIPGHPFLLTPFAVPYQEKSHSITSNKSDSEPYSETGQHLLPKLLSSRSSKNNLVFETSTQVLGPLIAGHNVGGICICPASLFHELILEAAHLALTPSKCTILTVHNISFPTPLIYEPAEGAKKVHVSIRRLSSGSRSADIAEIEVRIKTLSKATEETLCCSAVALYKTITELEHRFFKDAAIVRRQSRHLMNSNNLHSTFRNKLLYETIFSRVVSYSPEYQALTSLSVSDSDLEGIGTFQLPMNSRATECIANTVFTDTLLHAAGFVANLAVPSEEICICGQVESIEILYDRIDYSESFTVYCSLIDIVKGTIYADAFAVNPAGKVVAAVRGIEFRRLRLSSFQKMLNHVDKAALMQKGQVSENETPVTLSAEGTGTATPSIQPDQEKIKIKFERIIGEVYGATDALDSNQSLAELGMDSMMQIEITTRLSQTFPHSSFNTNLLFNCETLQELEENLLAVLSREPKSKASIKTPNESIPITQSPSSQGSLDDEPKSLENSTQDIGTLEPTLTKPTILFHSSRVQIPLCVIHDGSGQTGIYRNLHSPDRSILGFDDPDFLSPILQTSSIEQMAGRYIASLSPFEAPSLIMGGSLTHISSLDPSKRSSIPLLALFTNRPAGWSFGGVVAYEAVRQLLDAGFPIRGLLLIDSPFPYNHKPLPVEVINYILGNSNTAAAPNNDEPPSADPYLLRSFKHCAHLLSQYNPPPLSPDQQSRIKTVMLRSADEFDAQRLCGVEYGWLERQDVRDEAIEGWRQLVGNLEVLDIEGTHFDVFKGDKVSNVR